MHEHDASILFPQQTLRLLALGETQSISDKIPIVVAGVKANHRHLLRTIV